MDNKVIKIGLLGLGTVGTGVYKLIGRRSDEMEQKIGANLEIEKILVHNLKKTRHGMICMRNVVSLECMILMVEMLLHQFTTDCLHCSTEDRRAVVLL